jgi:hypothetical protein
MLTCHEYLSRVGESRIQNISITIIRICPVDLLIHIGVNTIQTRTQASAYLRVKKILHRIIRRIVTTF